MNNLTGAIAAIFGIAGTVGAIASMVTSDIPHTLGGVSLVALAVIISEQRGMKNEQRDIKTRLMRIEAVFFKDKARAKGAGQ